MKLEFTRQIFEKYSDIKFSKNPCSGSRVTHAKGQSWRRWQLLFAILRRRLKVSMNISCKRPDENMASLVETIQ